METSQINKRKQKDMMNLMMSNYDVVVEDEKSNEIQVAFTGPKDSDYEGVSYPPRDNPQGVWNIRVRIPEQYPYKSPSIGFLNKIFHPNIDESSGAVCLDVLNQTWSPLFELQHVFDVFLPQLLLYPNPKDPLNGVAAYLMLKDPEKYKSKVIYHMASEGIGKGIREEIRE